MAFRAFAKNRKKGGRKGRLVIHYRD